MTFLKILLNAQMASFINPLHDETGILKHFYALTKTFSVYAFSPLPVARAAAAAAAGWEKKARSVSSCTHG